MLLFDLMDRESILQIKPELLRMPKYFDSPAPISGVIPRFPVHNVIDDPGSNM